MRVLEKFIHRTPFVCIALAMLLAPSVQAQDYPSRPIRMVVPQPPGGGTDILGRSVAQKLSEVLRQPVVVENKTGAGSLIGTEYVARAPADGYTLMVGGIFNMVMNKALIKNLSYSPEKDFISLGYVSAYPFVLLTRADLPVNNLAELVTYAKERPGKLTYGSGGLGTLQHVWGAILTSSLGLDMLHVPFKGASPAHQEMMGGRLDVMFDNMSASKQYVQSGRLKGLVVSSAARSPQLPTVPTVNESGLVKFEGESWFGIFAPAGTPAPVVAKLREALASINAQPDFSAKVERDGGRMLNIPAAQQQNYLRDEIDRWVSAVNRYNVTAD
ncbi:Bug family tripartite tricarboxylate transporter substrate binding protein [Limnohabitans sp.]|uniref:Bug family tripartite tricarboxylate transporter substrate binding protein n=1 Tax=Limnohabitans sp. TaxID=1907725 RepID=UPI0038B8448F